MNLKIKPKMKTIGNDYAITYAIVQAIAKRNRIKQSCLLNRQGFSSTPLQKIKRFLSPWI